MLCDLKSMRHLLPEWTSGSRNLNPIEGLSAAMKRRVEKILEVIESELMRANAPVWASTDTSTISGLIKSV
jgi:hypothetical protein